ncbi:MAG: methyltransferase [Jatrophihabitantaceae bacterium]
METNVAARPDELIWSITNSSVTSRALQVAAELGVADQVGEAGTPVAEVASRCAVDTGALERLLNLLSAVGIFTVDDGVLAHTEASLLLRDDDPGSLRPFARMMGLPSMWQALGALDHAVRTGRPGMELVDPGGFFGLLANAPADAAVFHAAMQARGQAFAAAVVHTYDFTPFKRIVDVAGGQGHLLRALLDAISHAEGVLFELPPVAALTPSAGRLTTVAGDFFTDPLPSGDAYLLMEILHDWPDDRCIDILTAIRRASQHGAVLLVIEAVLDEGAPDPRTHNLDVIMLVMTGGRERTVAEFRRLLGRAGFQLTSITPTGGPMRIVEAVAV